MVAEFKDEKNSREEHSLSLLLSWLHGAFVSVTLFAICFALLSADVTLKTISNWQTLIAGILALVGAMITVRAISLQISLARVQEDERRWRRNLANRAALPLALVELGGYLDECIDLLKPYNPAGNRNERIIKDVNWQAPGLPKFPHEANFILRSCIETSDAAQMKSLYDLVALLQIQNSRFFSFFKDIKHQSTMVVVTDNLNSRIIEVAQLATISANIFDYARLRKEEIEESLPSGSVEMRLFSSGVLEEDFPLLYEALRQGRGLMKLV